MTSSCLVRAYLSATRPHSSYQETLSATPPPPPPPLFAQVHVLVGVHGAGLNNAFYLRPGGSIVEVRPYGFGGADSWANMCVSVSAVVGVGRGCAASRHTLSRATRSFQIPPPAAWPPAA